MAEENFTASRKDLPADGAVDSLSRSSCIYWKRSFSRSGKGVRLSLKHQWESQSAAQLYFAEHQACAYGGKRPKWTRLAANFPQVATISKTCPGNHQHAPWGLVQTGAAKRVFATSLEVHYPQALCGCCSACVCPVPHHYGTPVY